MGPDSHCPLAKGVHQVPVWALRVTVFIDWDLGTGVNEKRDTGDPSLEWNKGALFAEMYVSISSYKAALGGKKKKIEQKQSPANNNLQRARNHSISWVRGAFLKRSLKGVTERNPSGCPFLWSQSWELHAALLIPVSQDLIRNRESLRNDTQRKKTYWVP